MKKSFFVLFLFFSAYAQAEILLSSSVNNPSNFGRAGGISDLSTSLATPTAQFEEVSVGQDSLVTRIEWMGSAIPDLGFEIFPVFELAFHTQVHASSPNNRLLIEPSAEAVAIALIEPEITTDADTGITSYSALLPQPILISAGVQYWFSIALQAPDVNALYQQGDFAWHWNRANSLGISFIRDVNSGQFTTTSYDLNFRMFGEPVSVVGEDEDNDGVLNGDDQCLGTEPNVEVNQFGCPVEEEVVNEPVLLNSSLDNPSNLGRFGAFSDLSGASDQALQHFESVFTGIGDTVTRVIWMGSNIPDLGFPIFPVFEIGFYEEVIDSTLNIRTRPDITLPIATYSVEPEIIYDSVTDTTTYVADLPEGYTKQAPGRVWMSINLVTPNINQLFPSEEFVWGWNRANGLGISYGYNHDTGRYFLGPDMQYRLFGFEAE